MFRKSIIPVSWSMLFLVFYFATYVRAQLAVNDEERPVWTWECVGGRCQKYPLNETTHTSEGMTSVIVRELRSVDVCKLLCGDPPGALWPLPTGILEIQGPIIPIKIKHITMSVTSKNKEKEDKSNGLHEKVLKYFEDRLAQKVTEKFNEENSDSYSLTVNVSLNTPYESFNLDTDESYELQLQSGSSKSITALISARTFFGMRHALETLTQLIVPDYNSKSFVMPKTVHITDKPAYSYRGLTLDTSRNFISLKSIKRTLDGMAANKLNIFHWHITDTHSFPFVSTSLPQLSKYGAYSPEKVYKPEDIKDILEYAKVRGIKVIPEFDAPAHVGEGWQWAPEDTVVCLNEQPWNLYCVEPPCGQFNPTKDFLYESILPKLYQDMMQTFEVDNMFHMGGDEVHFRCWNNNTQITNWMTSKGWSINDEGFLKLWNYFQENVYQIVKKISKDKTPEIILWTSGLTTGEPLKKYLDKNKYIIQIWTTGVDPNVNELLEKGYRVIFSNYDALYLDCGFGGWVTDGNNWCSPYKTWQNIYTNDPVGLVQNMTDTKRKQILGQSAALWTEQADDQTIDNRLWPRAAAMAERMWTNPSTSWKQAEYRMLHQRERLIQLGLAAEALQPLWCNQNEGFCPI